MRLPGLPGACLAALALLLVGLGAARAQTSQFQAYVVPDCGTVALPTGAPHLPYMTADGRLCINAATMPGSAPAGGLSVYRVSNTAGAAGMMVKASPGRIYSFNLCNTTSSARYVRFYDSTAPVPGTTAVYAGAIVISAGTCQQFTTNFGLAFPTGIGLGITAANGDADTTPAAAGDVTGFIGFQ